MHTMKYLVYKEEKHYVAQCLNVDVSSFGESFDEAIENLKEAVELYLEDDSGLQHYHLNQLFGNQVLMNLTLNRTTL